MVGTGRGTAERMPKPLSPGICRRRLRRRRRKEESPAEVWRGIPKVARTLAAERETAMTTRKKSRTDVAPAIGDRLLTLDEAAEVLRLSTRTVREYVKRGEISGK